MLARVAGNLATKPAYKVVKLEGAPLSSRGKEMTLSYLYRVWVMFLM